MRAQRLLSAIGLSTLSALACGGVARVSPPSDAAPSTDASDASVTSDAPTQLDASSVSWPDAAACGPDSSVPAVTTLVEDAASTDLCHAAPYSLPQSACAWHCLTRIQAGGAPETVLAEQAGVGYWLHEILAVTDSFVVATATWGPAGVYGGNWDTWGIVEVPTSGGGAPVLVDTFGKAFSFATDALVGDDGYLYYAWSTNPETSSPLTLERLSLATLGAKPTQLAVAPESYWGASFALDSGYLYVGSESGISRVPVAGGALEAVFTDPSAGGYYMPGTFVVVGGTVYFIRGGELQALSSPGAAPFALPGPADEVAIGGCPLSLFTSAYGEVARRALDGSGLVEIVTSPADIFGILGFDGPRLLVSESCPPPAPEAPGGGFVRYFDLRTGENGLLGDLPGYPFATGTSGAAHDPAGTALYYLE